MVITAYFLIHISPSFLRLLIRVRKNYPKKSLYGRNPQEEPQRRDRHAINVVCKRHQNRPSKSQNVQITLTKFLEHVDYSIKCMYMCTKYSNFQGNRVYDLVSNHCNHNVNT